MLLEINDLSKSFFEKLLFKDVNLEIEKGDKVALIGHNGAGKTTLLKIITDMESADTGSVFLDETVKVSYFDQFGMIDENMSVKEILDIAFKDILEVSDKLAVLEEKMGCMDDLEATLEEYAIVQEEFDALGGYDYINEQNKFIQTFGLANLLDANYSMLSGGERQYIRLALTIFNQGDLIILDEPLSFFDKAKVNWLTKFINNSPKTFLVISHHPKFIASFANKILDVDNLTIHQYNCKYEDYLKEKIILLQELAIENEQRDEIIKNKQSTVDRATIWMDTSSNSHRIALMIKRLEKEIDQISNKKTVFIDEKEYDFISEEEVEVVEEQNEIINVQDVNLSFDDKVIFKNLNFSLNTHEKISIIGSNSAGKTTFFKMLMGELNPNNGKVDIDKDVKMIFIPQEVSFENDRMTVFEYSKVASGLGDELAEEALLKLFGDSEYFQKRLFTLSGGEKKRLQIMLHMVGESNVMLIDEPTTFMDEYTKVKIVELINQYNGALILVTHDKDIRDILNIKSYNLIDKKLDLVKK